MNFYFGAGGEGWWDRGDHCREGAGGGGGGVGFAPSVTPSLPLPNLSAQRPHPEGMSSAPQNM